MSQQPEGFPFGLPFIFGQPDPEAQRTADQQQFEMEVLRHDIHAWITGMSLQECKMLKTLMRAATDNAPFCAFIEGQISMVLNVKHGHCTVCDKNHDEALQPPPPAPQPTYENTVGPADVAEGILRSEPDPSDNAVDRLERSIADGSFDDQLGERIAEGPMDDGTEQPTMPSFEDDTLPREEALAKWGVREYNQGDIDAGLTMQPGEKPVICINCSMLYQSLEDRMLRPPLIDGCTGCQHKSAHG